MKDLGYFQNQLQNPSDRRKQYMEPEIKFYGNENMDVISLIVRFNLK